MTIDHDSLNAQVLANCDISDALHAGLYSICGLALRLRDLYKWSHGIEPWQEDAAERVLAWIGEKESLWETLDPSNYHPLIIGRRTFDPFNTAAINRVLNGDGLYYGAGYAYSLKPTFFLARVIAQECVADRRVWCLGREYARDLATVPAFCQDGDVILRMEAARMFVWDQMAYMENSGRSALQFALKSICGTPKDSVDILRSHLDAILHIQKRTYIRHEIGELADTVFDRQVWRQMVSDYAHTPVELLVRALKDMLADTDPDGTLPDLIRRRDLAGLGFYAAFYPGMTRTLFHELPSAFSAFQGSQDWAAFGRCIDQVRAKARAYTGQILEIQGADPERRDTAKTRRAIEDTMRSQGLVN